EEEAEAVACEEAPTVDVMEDDDLRLGDELVLCSSFFFVHRSVFAQSGPMAPFQHLKRDGTLQSWRVTIKSLTDGALLKTHAVVSDPWLTKAHPDLEDIQRKKIKAWLDEHPNIEWIWLDWCSIPQETESLKRSSEEEAYFRDALNFSNTLYLCFPVLILQVFLAFRTFEEKSIKPAAGAAQPAEILCDDPAEASALEEEWSHGSMEEALARMSEGHVKVMNQKEKALQVSRLKFLEPMLGLLQEFEEQRQAYLAAASGGDALATAESLFWRAEQANLAAGASRSEGYADLLQSMGANHHNRGLLEEAMEHFRWAEQAYLAAGASRSVGYAYLAAGASRSGGYAGLLQSMGANHHNRGILEEAMEHSRRAEQAYLAAGASRSVGYASLLQSVGANLDDRELLEEAMEHYRRAV
ncbi:unnamed protein product, partial [Prorocentrum cordatum]